MANTLPTREQRVIYRALRILETHFKQPEHRIGVPADGRDYLRLRFAGIDREEVLLLFLDNDLRLIASEVVAIGSLSECAVYPREVARRALQANAHAVVMAHNHPGGIPEPSDADIALTRGIKHALAVVGVTLIDHFVVTTKRTTSLAELGLV